MHRQRRVHAQRVKDRDVLSESGGRYQAKTPGAIKFLPRHIAADPEARHRFEIVAQASAAAKFSSSPPHVV